MKIHVKYLRYESYKITLKILATPIDYPIIRWSTAIKTVLLALFTLAKVSSVKVKSKA